MPRNDDVSRTLRLADLISEQYPGTSLFVDADNGNDANDGESWDYAKETIQSAVDAATARDRLILAPASYAEELSILRTKPNLTLIGAGARGAVAIEADTDGVALTNHADNLALLNIDLAGDGAGGALVTTGNGFRARECKLEGGTTLATLGPGTAAQAAAGTKGHGGDGLFEDCEFAWSDHKGVVLQGTDYGAATQQRFRDCVFHNIPDAAFEEATGSGGLASLHYRNLIIEACTFDSAEDGTAPTKFLSLNDDNANTGIVRGCAFPTAINGGKNLVSTALKWVGNYHTGGLSAAQPS